jgi:F-type H+-transporting ATPase subunit delta
MSKVVAKRYVKAIMDAFDAKELKDAALSLKEISEAFSSMKFKTIIASPDVSKDKKRELILSFLKNPDKRLVNFINLLNENKRLLFLKDIYQELEFQISLKSNRYNGKIYSNLDISKEQIEDLQKNFGKKFGAQINFETHKSNYSGIKVQIDDLGIETSFSIDRLKAQMTEHILKAI